jgi:glyoxylase-like metal-dependent hydrolase (beta-lactamase superfamily II)
VRLLIAIISILFTLPAGSFAALYTVTKVDERVYAAVVEPVGPVASNAFIVVTPTYVVAAGAHFTADATAELTRIIADITPLPLRYVILTHHHQGYSSTDFDFPPTVEIITSTQTWAMLKTEQRTLKNQVVAFDKGMWIYGGKQKIFLNSMEAGHSSGDVVVYLPDQAVLFTSDMLFNDEAGFMADGSARGWVQNLQQLENLVVTKVVPGRGDVTDSAGLRRFRMFLQEFLTEVLSHVERGESVEETVRNLTLSTEKTPPNFTRYHRENVEWAWRELQQRR